MQQSADQGMTPHQFAAPSTTNEKLAIAGGGPSAHSLGKHPQGPTPPQQPPVDIILAQGPAIPSGSHSIQIRTAFMDQDKQAKAVELAREACTNEKICQSPRDIAGHIKTAFDALYGPAWHCIVGRSYGSFVTHGTPREPARLPFTAAF